MYHLTNPHQTVRFATLLEVFEHVDRLHANGPFESTDVSLFSEHLGEIEVTETDGRFAIRAPGNAPDLLRLMLNEVRTEYFLEGSRQREPHEVEAPHWRLLTNAVVLARYYPKRLLSFSQIDACHFVGGSVMAFADSAMMEVFGFGLYGPIGESDQEPSLLYRHHLGQALLANRPIPSHVLSSYTIERDATGRADWVALLVAVPALRGRVSYAHVCFLAEMVQKGDITINSDNTDRLVLVLKRASSEASAVELDDLLFDAGLLHVGEVSDLYIPSRYVGVPVSPIAEAVQRHLAEEKLSQNAKRVNADRLNGGRSKRSILSGNRYDEARYKECSWRWANDAARAIAIRNMPWLLSVLDQPDSGNRGIKLGLQETLGVTLLGLRASERRRAVFAMCGFDVSQQSRIECELGDDKGKQHSRRGPSVSTS